METRIWKQILMYAAIVAATICFVSPIYWMLATSLKSGKSILKLPPQFLPVLLTFQGHHGTLTDGKFLILYKNNITVSGITTLVMLTSAALTLYASSRYRFRGDEFVMMLFLPTQMFPAMAPSIALYNTYYELGLLNVHTALVLACSINTLSILMWILKGFFDMISRSLEEAAYIDSCSKTDTLVRVTLPLVKPGILAVELYSFLVSQGDFPWGLTLVDRTEMRTLVSGIAMTYLGEYNYNWGRIIVAAVGAAISTLIIPTFLQKYMISGLTAGVVEE